MDEHHRLDRAVVLEKEFQEEDPGPEVEVGVLLVTGADSEDHPVAGEGPHHLGAWAIHLLEVGLMACSGLQVV